MEKLKRPVYHKPEADDFFKRFAKKLMKLFYKIHLCTPIMKRYAEQYDLPYTFLSILPSFAFSFSDA